MQFETFLEGNTVDLVIINHDLITNHSWHTWLNDQKLTKYTNQGYFPITEEENYQYFKDNILSKKRIQLGVLNKRDNNLVGMLSLYNIHSVDRCCDLSSIFNKKDPGVKSIEFFRESQFLLITHAFNKLNLRNIYIYCNRIKTAKMNERLFGFELQGTLKERDYKDGKYEDRYILVLTKKKWQNSD